MKESDEGDELRIPLEEVLKAQRELRRFITRGKCVFLAQENGDAVELNSKQLTELRRMIERGQEFLGKLDAAVSESEKGLGDGKSDT